MLHRSDFLHAEMPKGADMASSIKVCATAAAPLRASRSERGKANLGVAKIPTAQSYSVAWRRMNRVKMRPTI